MRRPLRLSIAQKMLLGYAPLVFLLFALSAFALVSLNRFNGLARSIVGVDVPVGEAVENLSEVLLAQDLYGRRFLILRDQGLVEVFWRRSAEFDNLLRDVRLRLRVSDPSLESLGALHRRFDLLFAEAFNNKEGGLSEGRNRELREVQQELTDALRARETLHRKNRDAKLLLGAAIGDRAFAVTAALCGLGLIVGVGAALWVARGISGSLRTLKQATRLVADRRFDQLPPVEGTDELAELFRSFEGMARQLKRLEETCLDANPLTRLPGGMAIENLLRRRLVQRWPLAFCLLDLDNFKAYGDKYGYARGSEVLVAVAKLLEQVVARIGAEQDFVGHIGGDDFVLVTTTGRYEGLCRAVIEGFDSVAPTFYDRDDRDRGYIEGKTRQGESARFPLMTISIAVVTNPEFRLKDPLELGAMAAHLKERAKEIPGSVFVVEGSWEEHAEEATS